MSHQPPNWQSSPPLPKGTNPFAEEVNPYAAPREVGYQPQRLDIGNPFAGLWRQGNVLVMHKLAPLPDICIKSNQPATCRLKRALWWHHPAVFIALPISPLIYIILALILRKSATIYIPLTEEWFARRRRRMAFAWLAVVLSVCLFVAAVAGVDRRPEAGWVMMLSVFLCIGATIYGTVACRLIVPKRISDEYLWLKGVHPDFLNRLEVWQWNV